MQSTSARGGGPSFLTSVNLKFGMAVTGAGLTLFVLFHLLGNLQIYLGATALNAYAHKLKSLGVLLWIARLGLVALFTIHFVFAAILAMRNRKARPTSYAMVDTSTSSLASRTMLPTGLAILAFLLYHLMHFTLGATDPTLLELRDDQGYHDVYAMVVSGFQNPLVVLTYVVAQLFLAVHLSHAVPSLLQTLGLATDSWRDKVQMSGLVLALFISLGNVSIPVAAIAGWLPMS